MADYRIAGYIGGDNIWRIARKGKKIAIGGYIYLAVLVRSPCLSLCSWRRYYWQA